MHVPEAARSALWDVTPLSGRATLAELGPVGKIDLRLDPENAEAACTVRAATGIDLPVMANTVSEGKARRVFWLGPDQWLLHCPLEEAGACVRRLEEGLTSTHHAVTEVSDETTSLRLGGPACLDVMYQGCPIDLHPSVFPVGSCARTMFAKAPVLLHAVDEAPTFDLHVRRSCADYLWRYLDEAARSHG